MAHKPMTTEEAVDYINSLPGLTLKPAELAKVLGGDPYAYNIEAKQGRLPFPYFFRGRDLHVLKAPLVRLLTTGQM